MWDKMPELAAQMGITLKQDTLYLFSRFYEHLIAGNQRMNLTRITEPHEVMVKHFLDSLAPLAWQPNLDSPVLDMGSGAGMPGIPLKIAVPEVAVTLVDSLQKKVDYLAGLANLLQLADVKAIHGRAEELGKNPDYREQYSVVVSRAVARLNVLAELCLPFVRVGGFFCAYKGPDAEAECREAERALPELGASVDRILSYSLPLDMGQRVLVVMRKNEVTPAKYPRKAGIPAKRPL